MQGSQKIYVASSWRNMVQPAVVHMLRSMGHEVYDFKNPEPGNHGFSWKQVSGKPPEAWTEDDYFKALDHPIARDGFSRDMTALRNCDSCVLVLPCGRSAHLELGHANGAGKSTYVILPPDFDGPDLMYLMCNRILRSANDLFDVFPTVPGSRLHGMESEQ